MVLTCAPQASGSTGGSSTASASDGVPAVGTRLPCTPSEPKASARSESTSRGVRRPPATER
eukprot:scaffold204670_cov31-Tisochrysis_lutea.AAC.3